MQPSPLTISIKGLRVFAHHGVFEFERVNGQDFFIDVSVWIDGQAAAANDDLAKTVNYGELANAVVGDTTGIVKRAKVTVHKPKAPIDHEFEDVSVTVKAKRK